MYYINSFFLYSLLGFIVESTIFKNTILKPSGVLNGPITLVYGVGGIISFIIYTVVLTLVELICGYLCHFIFNVDMWNYTDKKYNIGKYICLEYIGVWGIYGLITTYIIKPYIDKIIKLIPKDLTYISILILALDIIITTITK